MANITSSSSGFLETEVKDAGGNVVLIKTLKGAAELDSFSGVTSSGTSGILSVRITLSSFDGNGNFFLSIGN